MLYYKGKSRQINEIVEASMHLISPIEIVPLNQTRFDIVSFIEFADALTKEYICSYFSNTSYQIELYAHKAALDDHSVSFIIKIKKNYSDINVYIQDAIHTMTIQPKEGIKCIVLEINSIKENEFDIFGQTSYKWNDELGKQNSVLFRFGQFVSNRNCKSPIFLKNSFSCLQDPRTKNRNKTSFASFDNMKNLIEHLPGYVYFKYQDPPKVLPDHVFTSSLINIDDKPKIITSFLWILPFTHSIIKQIHYMEVDASFKACKPFKYCIYQGIYFNASIPLALSFAPEESTQLYEMLFNGCKKHGLIYEVFEGINVLSDMGGAIQAFCNLHQMPKNFCHRHIIEAFGARSSFGLWSNRLLKCKTHEEYLKQREYVASELLEYERKIKEIEKEKLKMHKTFKLVNNMKIPQKIIEIKIMLYDPDFDAKEKAPIKNIENSNYYIYRWAIWVRKFNHIPRCSNHSEGTHGNINHTLPSRGKKSIKVGLSKIANYIISHISRLPDTYGNSFKIRHSKFMSKVTSILKEEKADSYTKCFNKECNCDEREYTELIYGVQFPCIHTCMNKFVLNENLKYFLDCFVESKDLPTIKDFFLDLLDIFPHKYFESAIFDRYKSIDYVKQIKKKYEIQYPNFNEYLAENIALPFLTCFTFTLPQMIQFDNKFTFNMIEKDNDNEQYDFISHNEEEEEEDISIKKFRLRDEVHRFTFTNSNNEIARLIKLKFEETMNEILTVYPELENDSSLSCFEIFIDDYMPIINLNDPKINIVDILSSFKIQCWKRADEVANQNVFFPFKEIAE